MEETPYKILRPDIQTGDAALWIGNDLKSRLIRLFTKYSHASLIVILEGVVYLVESIGSGLELRRLSKRIAEYNGEVFLFKPDGMTEQQRETIRKFAIFECSEGKRYDFRTFFRLILGKASQDAAKFICSEFVWEAWIQAGFVERTKYAPTPAGLVEMVKGKITKIEKETLINVLPLI